MTKTWNKVIAAVNAATVNKAVKAYALEIIERKMDLNNYSPDAAADVSEKELLGGAPSWMRYSEGGCSLITDCEIAERLYGDESLGYNDFSPKRRLWHAEQAEALAEAAALIRTVAK